MQRIELFEAADVASPKKSTCSGHGFQIAKFMNLFQLVNSAWKNVYIGREKTAKINLNAC